MHVDYSKVVCFDLEMQCWGDGRTGDIISIGAVLVDLQAQELQASAHYIVRPDVVEISEFCTQLTGLSESVIKKQGRPLGAVLSTLRKNFGGAKRLYTCWGHDDQVLGNECTSKGLETPVIHCINAADIFMLKKRHNGSRIGMKKAMEMADLAFVGQAHNALVDSENLARLIIKTGIL